MTSPKLNQPPKPIILTRPSPVLFPRLRKLTLWERLLRARAARRIARMRAQSGRYRQAIVQCDEQIAKLNSDLLANRQEREQLLARNAYLSDENERLSLRNRELDAEHAVLRVQIETLELVVLRDRERVEAETHRYVMLREGLPMPTMPESDHHIDGV